MKKHTAIDLFSGCGGLTLGLKLAGFNVLAAVENDALAVETYQSNHKKVHVCHDDIRAVKAKPLRERLKLRVSGNWICSLAVRPARAWLYVRATGLRKSGTVETASSEA